MSSELFITKPGASYSVKYLVSFKTQKEFTDKHINEVFLTLSVKERRKLLGEYYKEALKLNDGHT